MPEKRILLNPLSSYCIYNRSVGDDKFFLQQRDYSFFTYKMKEYLLPIADIIAHCLQPNYFYVIVKIKSASEVENYLEYKLGEERYNKARAKPDFIRQYLSRIFANLFNSYAKHYNHINGRVGTLFKRAFMRRIIESKEQLLKEISCIHDIPVRNKIVSHPKEWRYSSYLLWVSRKMNPVKSSEKSDFNRNDNFIDFNIAGHPT